jgi:putative ABC transport system permease protein
MAHLLSTLKDYFSMAVGGIRKRKLRSWLTMLGIFVGIAAVVGLISISQGLQNAVTQQFSSLGANRIIVMAGSGFMTAGSTGGVSQITKHDLDLIRNVRGIKEAAGYDMQAAKFDFNHKTKFVYAMGIPSDDTADVFGSTFEVSEGRKFRSSDSNSNVALIGNNYLTDSKLFGKIINVGNKITLEGQEFKVIGIMKKIGNPSDDQQVYLPVERLWSVFGREDQYSGIYAETEAGFKPSDVAARVKEKMRKDRDQKEGNEDFQVQTSEQLLQSFSTILNVIQAVIVGIAAISLLVGSIGVMNTMYTAVLERTREIGIMKAVGARNRDVMLLFLIESGLYGLVGGLVGIAFGLGLGKIVEIIASGYLGSDMLRASMSPVLIFGALAFSFLLGCISGVAPARQASRLNPVQALRYE